MARLFGTDGVRGIANADLSCELTTKIGATGAYVLANEVHNPRILVGSDTRRSGDMLAAALTAGICSVGGEVISVGIMPTPAVAYLARLYGADAAVMISASHNTMEYNGVKWFSGSGYKLSDELEDRIERIIEDGTTLAGPTGEGVGHVIHALGARDDYAAFIKSMAEGRFDGYKVAIDCANGASSGIAERIFRDLGAEVVASADRPDGFNINRLCGSTHPQTLAALVRECGADIGFAFDGDADRVIAVDEHGGIVDGDRIMGICAESMMRLGTLKNDTLVLTVMSNLGLKQRMRQLGINVEETAVGDRYVLERMLQGGHSLGGEQSGHVIFLDKNTTGDGLLTAVAIMNVMKAAGLSLSELASKVPIYPQILINVAIYSAHKVSAMHDKDVILAVEKAQKALGRNGRVLIRPSGTEPLIRIMIEGEDEAAIGEYAMAIARVIETKFGGSIC